MKICDIISEDVDMSWWKERDSDYNPEALEYVQKQEDRQDMIDKRSPNSTNIIKKPVRKSQTKFSNKPAADSPKSNGYAGNVDVRVRAKHISKKTGDKLLDLD